MKTQAEIDAILRDVQRRFDAKRSVTGLGFHVPAGGFDEHDGWLSVIVQPDLEGIHAYQYVDALSTVQQELRSEGVEKVLLVPAIA